MDNNSDRITWTVIILALAVMIGGLFIKFVPNIGSQVQGHIQDVADTFNGTRGRVDSSSNSDFTYSGPNTADDTISITGYKGNEENLSIPQYHKIGSVYYKVTAIKDFAFRNNTSIKQVTIPDSVTSIGYEAFDADSNLSHLTLGSGVTSIGAWAFANTALTSVDIPDSVTSIGYAAFYADSNLNHLTLGSGVTSIGNAAFNGDTALTSVDIPDGVTSIGDNAFAHTALTRVDFPASLKSIGDRAFYCTSMSAISFKKPVDLGKDAFRYTNLTNVTLPTGSTYIKTGSDSTFNPTVNVTVK